MRRYKWAEALDTYSRQPGNAIVIGAVDTGKTTFCLELVSRKAGAGRRVALVDCDVGQSTLGPPCTIGARIFGKDEAVAPDLFPPFIWFVGSVSPENRMIQCIVGAQQAFEWARREGASDVVVDSTGLVSGDKARRLKAAKVDLLKPDVIFGLEREEEIEHLLRPMERRGVKVVRIECPEAVVRRPPEMRRSNRRELFTRYFAGAATLDFALEEIAIYECPSNWAGSFPSASVLTYQYPVRRDEPQGLIVGLGGESAHTLALGMVRGFDPAKGTITVLTPLPDKQPVRFIEFGCIFLDDIPVCDRDGGDEK